MIRRLLIPLLGAGLLLAATAGSAFAKCEGDPQPEFCKEVAVSIDVGGGGIFHAGVQESVAINVSLAEQPYDAQGVTLTFARISDGTVVQVDATETSVPGLWQADVLLTNGGGWTVVAEVIGLDGAMIRVPIQTVQLPNPPGIPPPTTPAAPPVTPTTPALPIALLAAGLAAAVLTGLVIRDRSRRTAGAAAPSGASPATADRA